MDKCNAFLLISHLLSEKDIREICLQTDDEEHEDDEVHGLTMPELINIYMESEDYYELGRFWLGLPIKMKTEMAKMLVNITFNKTDNTTEKMSPNCKTYWNILNIPDYLSSSNIHPYCTYMIYNYKLKYIENHKLYVKQASDELNVHFKECIHERDVIENCLKEKESYSFSCLLWALNACVLMYLTKNITEDEDVCNYVDTEKFITNIHSSLDVYMKAIEQFT
jgi:hypothetical protein